MRAAIRRVLPAGLRWRFAGWVAGVLLVSIAALFIVVYEDTGTQLSSQIDRDVASDTAQLAQVLAPLQGSTASRVATVARTYVQGQPYTATSTLLFVLVPGQVTASNHLEVFGAAGPESGETPAEQQRENRLGLALLVPHVGYSTRAVPDVGRMRIHEQVVALGGFKAVVGAAEPLAIVQSAQRGVARAFVLAAAITLGLALLASYFVGARVSSPLRRMAAVAAQVDAGDLLPRMDISLTQGSEVRVLAEAFNHMLDRLSESFATQQDFIADASHELRTPITVIRGQLEVLAAQANPSQEEVRRVERLVGAEITRISRLVDDLLVLAQAERAESLRIEPIDVRAFVGDLWDGVTPTADRRFELGEVPDGTLNADPDRLAQALRNLARNAVEHTAEGSGLVRLEVDPGHDGHIVFSVLDDGPGIPLAERERVFARFYRTDRGRSRKAGGAGLGLAIVRATAQAHGGEVRATDGVNGRGARVELSLPGFHRAQARVGSGERTEWHDW